MVLKKKSTDKEHFPEVLQLLVLHLEFLGLSQLMQLRFDFNKSLVGRFFWSPRFPIVMG